MSTDRSGDTPLEAAQEASPFDPSSELHPLEQQRRENRALAERLGYAPYGAREASLLDLRAARARYDASADLAYPTRGTEPVADERPVVRVAGRIVLRRLGGSLIWLTLRDPTGELQIAVSKKDCGGEEGGFGLAKRALDLGDIVVAVGPLMRTKTGELTVWASELRLGSKCILPPPDKHAGLQDTEARYRQRYLDLWSRPESMNVFLLRAKLLSELRRFLENRGFLEVETPVFQPIAGGAAARPFIAHMNALDIDLYLRIAPELYLKRLLVGGMPRVFEVSRNFRNEGVDRSHNPEFTSVEVYEAFGNCDTMMELTESLIRHLATQSAAFWREVTPETAPEGLVLPFGDLQIDYGAPFRRVSYDALFEASLGFPRSDAARVLETAKAHGLPHEGLAPVLVADEVFEELALPTLRPDQPTFVTDYPAALSPLTRPNPANPELAERWDIYIGGMEIGPAYTELNDPDVQYAKFREQLAGQDDEEATFRSLDDDFLTALKVGMPPAGGLGLGIDRLTMLLANQRSIRDVILFPFMRPKTTAARAGKNPQPVSSVPPGAHDASADATSADDPQAPA